MEITKTPKTRPGHRTDIGTDGWLGRVVPKALKPFVLLMRLDRPIGTWLLLLPCLWAIALSSKGELDFGLIVLFAMGAIVMRGAGCTYNDIIDRNFDTKVERTAIRPIASGAISVQRARLFLIAQLFIGFIILLQFNSLTIALGVFSLILIFLYPFMKRHTYWPQAWLGLTFNWGVLMGWTAVTGGLAWSAIALYGAGFFWTLGYDTIYAHQDKEYDILIGIKSSALALGSNTRPFIAVVYAISIVLICIAAGLMQLNLVFFLLLSIAAGQLGRQTATIDINDAENCLQKFRSNRDFGLIVVLALASIHS